MGLEIGMEQRRDHEIHEHSMKYIEIRVVGLAIHGNVKKNPVGIVQIRNQSFFPRL